MFKRRCLLAAAFLFALALRSNQNRNLFMRIGARQSAKNSFRTGLNQLNHPPVAVVF